MDDKWIDRLRDKMAEYEVALPDSLLESVQDKANVLRTRRRHIYFAIAASIAIIGVVSIAIIPTKEQNQKKKDFTSKVAKSSEGAVEKESVNVVEENAAIYEGSRSKPQARGKVTLASVVAVDDPESGFPVEVSDNEEETRENSKGDKDVFTLPKTPSKQMDSDNAIDCQTEGTIIDFRSTNRSSVSVGVFASANGLGGLLEEDNMGIRPVRSSSSMPFTRMGCGVITTSSTDNNQPSTFVELFHHKLPARFSIDFSWPVWHNLSVGTGITYSYLHSDIRYGYSDSPLFKASQDLHFLGIPVSVRYIPWSFRKLDIYASAAFMAEKCIGGGIKPENPSDPGYRYTGCDDRPFQFSFNAAVGLQYSLAERCAVFIEPGVGIYLKNGSKLRTIYSERPLTFNVNVGLRFGRVQ